MYALCSHSSHKHKYKQTHTNTYTLTHHTHQTECEYIDLGSSCGSKLNGKSVLRARLKPGDVIEIGQSTLIFHTKKRRRFSIFGKG